MGEEIEKGNGLERNSNRGEIKKRGGEIRKEERGKGTVHSVRWGNYILKSR